MTTILPRIVIAVPDYVPSEISVIKSQPFDLLLADDKLLQENKLDLSSLPTLATITEAMLRSPRLSHEAYQRLYETLLRRNIQLINTPEMVRCASEFELHYPLIEEATPRSIVLSANISTAELFEEVQRRNLRLPLFVKTEIKSLKSVSVISELKLETIDKVLENLRTQLSGFYRIIVREMVKLKSLPEHSDTTLEYRAFVMHNKIVMVQDGTEGKPSPSVAATGADHFYEHWVNKLASVNFSNFYILDIAQLADSSDFVIIEIKDGQYTKVRDVDSFWKSLPKK